MAAPESGLGVAGVERREEVRAIGRGGAADADCAEFWVAGAGIEAEKRLRSAISLCL
jgi:hypothetical protein